MSTEVEQTPVLIVGGGPIGLALAAELSLFGAKALLVDEQPNQHGDVQVGSAKMIVVSMRTVEFCRQLGLASAVRDWGFPLDHGMDSVFVTSMQGWELGRVPTPTLKAQPHSAHSPERDRPCPQTWFDPILRNYVRQAGTVELRASTRLMDLVQDEHAVTATIVDTNDGTSSQVRADFVIGCDGYHSTVREQLGIVARGEPHLDLSMSVYVRIPSLVSHHDKGDAYRYIAVDWQRGPWAVLTSIDGHDLYRLQLVGANDIDVREHDLDEVMVRLLGDDVPYVIEDVSMWERKMTVADRFADGRIFLAGDAAHAHPPNGGLGMNTGIPDAWSLGWQLAAQQQGWGARTLLDAYDIERRPACSRAARESLNNYHRLVDGTWGMDIEGPDKHQEREDIGKRLVEQNVRAWNPVGIHLGYLYHPSPVIVDDGSTVPEDDAYGYAPTARPGARAPHLWLEDGSSILDRFGPWFTLLNFGSDEAEDVARAAAERSVPLRVERVSDVAAAELYERKLVLVRPDGHVAWRDDHAPADPLALIDVVRGAGLPVAACHPLRLSPSATVG